MAQSNRPPPTDAWRCGDSAETTVGCCWQSGRDKGAEAAVISVECGGVPRPLASHGYGLVGRAARREAERWRTAGKGGIAQ